MYRVFVAMYRSIPDVYQFFTTRRSDYSKLERFSGIVYAMSPSFDAMYRASVHCTVQFHLCTNLAWHVVRITQYWKDFHGLLVPCHILSYGTVLSHMYIPHFVVCTGFSTLIILKDITLYWIHAAYSTIVPVRYHHPWYGASRATVRVPFCSSKSCNQ